MVKNLLLTSLLVACGGPVDATLVDELRVVAAIPSAPEARPGEAIDIQITLIEPDDQPVDLMVWLCTPAGPPGAPCVESNLPFDGVASVKRTVVDEVSAELVIPQALAQVLSDELPDVASSIWVLTCEPGLCGVMDDLEASPQPGSDAHTALGTQLSNPSDMLRVLPVTGVAASSRKLAVSTRDDDVRNVNPVVSGSLPEQRVAAGEELVFLLDVVDDQQGGDAFGYATDGGFSAASSEVVDGTVELTWIAPDEPLRDEVTLLVVVQDGLGGEGLWRTVVSVEP